MSGSTACDVEVKKHLISSSSHRKALLLTLFCSFMVEKKSFFHLSLPRPLNPIGLGPLFPRLEISLKC